MRRVEVREVSGTAERVALNQSAFREANEKVGDAAERLLEEDAGVPFLCECPERTCMAIVRLSLGEYERVRARGDTFLVAAGHEICVVDAVEVARIEERHDGWTMMAKVDEAGAVARATDPRA